MNTKGTIIALQICPAHRAPMQEKQTIEAISDFGLEGDRHAKAGGSRQVLLIDQETLDQFGLGSGTVRENITTRGIELKSLTPGMRVRAGTVLLQVTVACTPCSRMEEIRAGLQDALTGQRGMLARVIEGGTLRVGDVIEVVEN